MGLLQEEARHDRRRFVKTKNETVFKLLFRKNANAAMLSNHEVTLFKLLMDLKEQRKDSGRNKHSIRQQNLNTIMYETLKYLSKTPCCRQSPEIVKEFLTTMMPHKVSDISQTAEKLQLLNHWPQTAVEIQLGFIPS
uniref:DNA-directed RNA polymerase III subunit RPC9-like n=1 Tax=Epinephelus lanceolatus TaxID=310571 RepID=UPI0014478AAB|nr:DNA-directed RNA polymerase III subunit RPC9-like [Epinephelus lanceolatus]